jgi:acyl-coenzyme A thioesterase PaaI-like protein
LSTIFDDASAVTPRGDGGYRADVHPGWTHGGKANGGYLLAMIGRVAVAVVSAAGGDHPHPLAVNATYVSAPDVGTVDLDAELLRVGRSASQARVRLSQDGKTCVESVLTLGRLSAEGDPYWQDHAPVEVPPLEDCEGGIRTTPNVEGDMEGAVERRLDPATAGFFAGKPTGRGEFRGWFTFKGRDADPIALLFVADGYPPATLDLGSTGWVPTLELTVYNRALPAPGPLRVRQRTHLVQHCLFDEVCDVWDSRGRLVTQATQLAGVRFPEPANERSDT